MAIGQRNIFNTVSPKYLPFETQHEGWPVIGFISERFKALGIDVMIYLALRTASCLSAASSCGLARSINTSPYALEVSVKADHTTYLDTNNYNENVYVKVNAAL